MIRFKAIGLMLSTLLGPATLSVAQDVVIRQVTDHVMTLSMSNLGMHTNVTVITTRKGLVVVETEITPYIMGMIKEAAEKKLGRDDWAYVINTHGHLHHAGGNGAFKGVPIVGHEGMNMNWLKDRLATELGRRSYCRVVGCNVAISQLRRALAQTTLTAAQRQELRRRLRFCEAVQNEILAGFAVANPTVTAGDHYSLDLGDVHLRLTYWGDGINHSSIFVHVVEDRLLVGMGMAGAGMPDFYGPVTLAGIRQAIAVWQEIGDEDFPVDRMIGIHTPGPISSRAHFLHRAKYLQALLDDVTAAHQQGLRLEQVQDQLLFAKRYPDAHQYFTMPEDRNATHQKNIETIWALLQIDATPPSQN